MTTEIHPHNGHLLVHTLTARHDEPVLEIGEEVVTGGEFLERFGRFVHALDAIGLTRGSAIGVLARNVPEVLMALGAGWVRGYQRTSLQALASADDQAFVLTDAGIDTLIIDPSFASRAEELAHKVPGLKRVLSLGPADFGEDLLALAQSQPTAELEVADLPPDHVGSIHYTGGTTGRPKGVLIPDSAILDMTKIQLAEWEWPERPRFLICSPLSHTGGSFLLSVLAKGGTLIVAEQFDAGAVLETIERSRISATMLVPTMVYSLLDHPDWHRRDLSSLETVFYGASAMNPARLAAAIGRLGPVFAQFYAQSEAVMVVTYLSKRDHAEAVETGKLDRLLSCGRPSAYLRVRLADQDGADVAAGEPGEILVAGPVVAAGYHRLPDQSAATFGIDGWLRTGDIARADAEGYLYIVDRSKDMIVTGGFNVYPKEVENVVATDPAVRDVAVIGTPDERWGEAVTAVVVLNDGHVLDSETVDRIVSSVKQAKGSVCAPKQVLPIDAIPLTPLGKPDKKALRAAYWPEGRLVN